MLPGADTGGRRPPLGVLSLIGHVTGLHEFSRVKLKSQRYEKIGCDAFQNPAGDGSIRPFINDGQVLTPGRTYWSYDSSIRFQLGQNLEQNDSLK